MSHALFVSLTKFSTGINLQKNHFCPSLQLCLHSRKLVAQFQAVAHTQQLFGQAPKVSPLSWK